MTLRTLNALDRPRRKKCPEAGAHDGVCCSRFLFKINDGRTKSRKPDRCTDRARDDSLRFAVHPPLGDKGTPAIKICYMRVPYKPVELRKKLRMGSLSLSKLLSAEKEGHDGVKQFPEAVLGPWRTKLFPQRRTLQILKNGICFSDFNRTSSDLCKYSLI